MTYPLPTRTAGDSAAAHVADHNEIHELLGVTNDLPTGLTTASTGHLANQQRIHLILNTILAQTLDTSLAAGDSGHLAHHNAIHTLLNIDAPGIRGPYGPQSDSGEIASYPSSFTGTIGSGGTWTSFAAFQAAGSGVTNGKYQILAGTYTAPAATTVKSGQEFWGAPGGVTMTSTSGTTPAFTDGGSSKTNVKIGNISFVGFRRTITCNSSGGWEISYCDFDAENSAIGDASVYTSLQTVGPRHWIHHSHFHDTINPVPVHRNHFGVLIEDCEIDHITTTADGAWKAGVQSWLVEVRHCWLHDSSRGIWFDYWNVGSLIEWNLIEDNDHPGIEYEANPGMAGLDRSEGPWLVFTGVDPDPSIVPNVVRYNVIRNNGHCAIWLHGSSNTEVYGNIMYRNQQTAQIGLNDAEIQMYLATGMIDGIPPLGSGQGCDLAENSIHDNYFEITPTIGGHQPKRGATIQVDVTNTPYLNNTKNNDFYDNYYVCNRATSSTDLFYWFANKTFATWQALPQDATSSAEA